MVQSEIEIINKEFEEVDPSALLDYGSDSAPDDDFNPDW